MKTKRIKSTIKLSELLLTKPMYFFNDFEDCVVRTEPNKEGDVDYWIKYKGHIEFKGSPVKNNNIYETVQLESLSISKKDYDKH